MTIIGFIRYKKRRLEHQTSSEHKVNLIPIVGDSLLSSSGIEHEDFVAAREEEKW